MVTETGFCVDATCDKVFAFLLLFFRATSALCLVKGIKASIIFRKISIEFHNFSIIYALSNSIIFRKVIVLNKAQNRRIK